MSPPRNARTDHRSREAAWKAVKCMKVVHWLSSVLRFHSSRSAVEGAPSSASSSSPKKSLALTWTVTFSQEVDTGFGERKKKIF